MLTYQSQNWDPLFGICPLQREKVNTVYIQHEKSPLNILQQTEASSTLPSKVTLSAPTKSHCSKVYNPTFFTLACYARTKTELAKKGSVNVIHTLQPIRARIADLARRNCNLTVRPCKSNGASAYAACNL